ncbi:MAG: pantoate--beta-alanine ligase [Gemmatimonadaceae bacterium]|nr:pantoate--beta-alanine ligase [Gemmatimonadaceae bacterium]
MLVVRDVGSLRAAVAAARAAGERIAFVPTMGALHAGHLSLVDRATAQAGCVVVSIFVNPLQFAPTEDLAAYPRTEAEDLAAAMARGAQVAFVPPVAVMYPGPRAVSVVPEAIADRWEGAVRPGHFAGVLTVVAKLFNLVQPDVAVFGQKDLQQATLIAAMVRDLDIPVTLDIAPIVREPDGLAMSSRNRYLDAAQRRAARVLPDTLRAMCDAFTGGERDGAALCAIGLACLAAEPRATVDYLAIVDPTDLAPSTTAAPGRCIILAVRVGSTRLLDNHRLGEPFPPSECAPSPLTS